VWVHGTDSAFKAAREGLVGTKKRLVFINLPYVKVNCVDVSYHGTFRPFEITGFSRFVVLHNWVGTPEDFDSALVFLVQILTILPPFVRDRRLRWLGVNCQWGTTFTHTDELVIFRLRPVRMVFGRVPGRVTGGTFNIMLYTSVLGSRIVWVVVLQMPMTIVNGRIVGMSSSSTASRRELGNIQIFPRRVRVVVLADRRIPTRTQISNVMRGSALSGAGSWGSEIGEACGSSWIGMGAAVFMIIHRTDVFDTAMVRMVLSIPTINKCSRVEELVAH
jgi:hypothetical protein